jgi:hypothetical protein
LNNGYEVSGRYVISVSLPEIYDIKKIWEKAMIKVISIILASLILIGCSADTTQNKVSQAPTPAMEVNQANTTETKDAKLSAENEDKPFPYIEEVNKVNPEYQKYADFLGVNDDVASFFREDIDLDGKQEIIISFGIGFFDTFVLREDNDKLTLIGEIEGRGYNTYEVELVHLQELEQKYILTKITNGANLFGFALYKINNTELKQIAYSASATGSGDDSLIDTGKDGKYDGYVQDRASYDVMYLPTTRFYKLMGEEFVLESSHVELDDYPKTPVEVVEQYLKLSILHEEKSQEFDSRFEELSTSDKGLVIDASELWIRAITTQDINFEEDGSGDNLKVTAVNGEESIIFSLSQKDNKWQIIDMSGDRVLEGIIKLPDSTWEESEAIFLAAKKLNAIYNKSTDTFRESGASYDVIITVESISYRVYEVRVHPEYYRLSVFYYFEVDLDANTVKEIH